MLDTTKKFLKRLKPTLDGLDFPPIPVSDMWDKSSEVSAPHVKRVDPITIFKKKRPSENQESLEYRRDNYRWITKEGFDRFVGVVSQTLQQVIINQQSVSDELRNYWNEDSYMIANHTVGWKQYFFDYVARLMLARSNDIEIHLPFNVNDDAVPPSTINEPIRISTQIISHKYIKAYEEHFCMFWGGKTFYVVNGHQVEGDYFWGVDKNTWYKFVPVPKRGGGVDYKAIVWYDHKTGSLPVQALPGIITEHPTETGVMYHESFILPYFELANEYINRSSDEQVSAMKSSYEVRIYRKIDCQKCDGRGTVKLEAKDPDGLTLKVTGTQRCPSCNGTKKVSIVSPFQDIVFDDKVTDDRSQPTKASDIMSAYRPDVSIVKNNWDIAESLFKKMMQSIGLELIDDSSSSGESKKVVLEKRESILNDIATGLVAFMERHAWYIECLLVPFEDRRVKPKIILNDKIKIKDISQLQEEADSAIPLDRYNKHLEFVQHKYRGDETEIRKQTLMIEFCPLLLFQEDSIESKLAAGTIDDREYWKYYLAAVLFSKVNINENKTDKAILDAVEKLMDAEMAKRTTTVGEPGKGAKNQPGESGDDDEDGDGADGMDEIDAKYLKYESGELSRDEFTKFLEGLGFSKAEIDEAIGA